ncbi:MAG: hypothetical protein EOO15_20310 [Chitinophagaceae bacterium]|nr:MAG: hypothetical protein EOO15_20310 [Chitinophagaceae bacterium]
MEKQNNNSENTGGLRPDPETLHTTDPQEHMKGPLSSAMNGIADDAEEKGGETPDTPDTGQKMDGEATERT